MGWMSRRGLFAAAVASVLIAGCNDFSSTLRLRNLTPHTLTPYPVVTEPPPPHREPNANGVVPQGGTSPIDPAGFNPVFYAPGVTEPGVANGVYLGLSLMESDPLRIQYRVFHYVVPPGQTGQDPGLQPLLLHEGVVDVPDADVTITVTQPTDIGANPPPGGWEVEVTPN